MADFDEDYWDQQWRGDGIGPAAMAVQPPNPHLVREVAGLTPGTALDAGCGAGTEAAWLASRGWQTTGADVSAEALARAASQDEAGSVTWVQADLSRWEPGTTYDLVTSHYAHSAMPQLDFYDRLAHWVSPGGTLLIVGHLHGEHDHGHDHGHDRGHGQPPPETQVRAADITARLGLAAWRIETAEEQHRRVSLPDGEERSLHDVVVRATRQP